MYFDERTVFTKNNSKNIYLLIFNSHQSVCTWNISFTPNQSGRSEGIYIILYTKKLKVMQPVSDKTRLGLAPLSS